MLLRRYLPDEILNRPETDFIPPLSDWFRGPLATQANAIAHGSALADPKNLTHRGKGAKPQPRLPHNKRLNRQVAKTPGTPS